MPGISSLAVDVSSMAVTGSSGLVSAIASVVAGAASAALTVSSAKIGISRQSLPTNVQYAGPLLAELRSMPSRRCMTRPQGMNIQHNLRAAAVTGSIAASVMATSVVAGSAVAASVVAASVVAASVDSVAVSVGFAVSVGLSSFLLLFMRPLSFVFNRESALGAINITDCQQRSLNNQ